MGRPIGSKNVLRKGATIICHECGKGFWVIPARIGHARFCSHKCNATFHAGKIQFRKKTCPVCREQFDPRIDGGKAQIYCSSDCQIKKGYERFKTPKNKTCEQCGGEFSINTGQTYQTRFCSRQCRIDARPISVCANGFKRAYKRRGIPIDKCDWCGYSEHPEILGFHHKDRNRKNNALDNMALVCPNCHAIEHGRFINHGRS